MLASEALGEKGGGGGGGAIKFAHTQVVCGSHRALNAALHIHEAVARKRVTIALARPPTRSARLGSAQDFFATGRLLQMVDEPGSGTQAQYAAAKRVCSLQSGYVSLVAVSLVLLCMQTLKNLDFHPRMGLITQTLRQFASTDLSFFMMLFGIVHTIYAFVGSFIRLKPAGHDSDIRPALVDNPPEPTRNHLPTPRSALSPASSAPKAA